MRGFTTFIKTGASPMTDKAISPLRQRMIEDMTIRKFTPKTQHDYVQRVKNFAAFLGRSPDTASFEDVRRYQLHLAASGVGVSTLNQTVSTRRFFFRVTLRRHDIVEHTHFIHEPRKLPVVLNVEEVERLLAAAPGLKYKAALSVAYGAGLRAAEVISLKVSDIDSKRMIIRVEQGKGGKDRNVMLSPSLLDLLRTWWKVARPAGLAVPGPRSGAADDHAPAQSRLSRCRPDGGDQQARLPAHLAAQLRHPSARAEHRCPRHPGAARSRQARHHGALYPRRHQDDQRGHEPAGAYRAQAQGGPAVWLTRAHVAPGFGGCGYLPQPWPGLASSQCRPCQPRRAEGDVGNRELPHGGPRRPCRALRGLRLYDHRLQLLPQPALPEVPRSRREGMARRARGRSVARAVLSRGVHPACGHRRHRLPEQGGDLRHPIQGLR